MGFFSFLKRKNDDADDPSGKRANAKKAAKKSAAKAEGAQKTPKMKKGVKKKKAKGDTHNLSPQALREEEEAQKALRKKKKALKKKRKKAKAAEVKLAKKAKKKFWSLPSKLPRLKLGGKRMVREVKSEPISEEALGFTFKSERKEDERRQAVRVPVEGLDLRVDRVGVLPCQNISATGVAFRFTKARFKTGVKLKMAFIYDNKARASEVKAKVVRHERGVVGCEFEELDYRQEDVISKFLLIGQKQQAARRKG